MKAIARALSLAAAALVVALLVLYPRGVLRPDGTVPFGPMALLLLGMSAAWVHGFGLVPESKGLRLLFSPLVAWPLLAAGVWGIFCR